MSALEVAILGVSFFAAALLYSSVGHAGASGYLAVMALFGMAPAVMRPTALVLNIVVAVIATAKFGRAGCFTWRLFWPFAVTAVPLAFVGGGITLPTSIYRQLVGVVLLYSAWRLFPRAITGPQPLPRTPPIWLALGIGAVLGFLSGLTGVGGGIFLSPLLLLAGWATPRETSGVAAPFILVNSVAGLAGFDLKSATLPDALPIWIMAVVIGGWIGAGAGSRKLAGPAIRRVLAAVLVIAGAKMIFA